MNAALLPMARRVVESFRRALSDLGLRAPFYVSQNDGSLLTPNIASRYPVLTFASGPTNSMRGARFLPDTAQALVMDIGGTTTDVGVLVHGAPRESVDRGRHRRRAHELPHAGPRSPSASAAAASSRQSGKVAVGPRSVGFRIYERGAGLRRQPADGDRHRGRGGLRGHRRQGPRRETRQEARRRRGGRDSPPRRGRHRPHEDERRARRR